MTGVLAGVWGALQEGSVVSGALYTGAGTEASQRLQQGQLQRPMQGAQGRDPGKAAGL